MSRIVDIEPLLNDEGIDFAVNTLFGSSSEKFMFKCGTQEVLNRLEVLPIIDEGNLSMRWVSVNDPNKYPKHEKPYIVNLKRIDSGKCENAFAKYDCDLDVWQLCDDDGTLFGPDGSAYYSPEMNCELTHWMEQPKPPKEN